MQTVLSDYELSTHVDDGVPVLSVRGQVDMSAVQALIDALDGLMGHRSARHVVDLGGVTFLDSQALGALVEAQWHLEGLDPPEAMNVVLGSPLRRLFGLAGLLERFVVHDSLGAALAGHDDDERPAPMACAAPL
jgi:anti-sigma B factor antagonist